MRRRVGGSQASVHCPCARLRRRAPYKGVVQAAAFNNSASWHERLLGAAAVVVVSAGLLLGQPAASDARARLGPEEQKQVDMFLKNTSSVVNVTSLSSRRDAFTSDMQEYPQGAGSGIVWDSDGHVVTNYHVVKGAASVQVVLDDGLEFTGRVIGQDEDKDVAVLELQDQSSALKPAAIGSSSDVAVGQKVYAIGVPPLHDARCSVTGFLTGNPFGLDHTLTTGIVSGIHREIQSGITGRPIQDAIQTDAAINPGNSGGPLLDSAGEVIGINTAIYSPSGANSGVGFAIPCDTVRESVNEIVATGRVVKPVLGIAFAPDASTSQLGVNGILVLSVRENGPAAKAGIRGTSRDTYGRLVLGDIIIGANGKKVKMAADLYRALDKIKVGQVVDLELLRTDSKEHVSVTMEANQSPKEIVINMPSPDKLEQAPSKPKNKPEPDPSKPGNNFDQPPSQPDNKQAP